MPPAAVWCDYECGFGRPSPPSRCLEPDRVYSTRQGSWLILHTRFLDTADPLALLPKVSPEWSDIIAGDMTWEGYFKVDRPPSPSGSMLMGTYGTNHDTDTYFIDATSRRRHAAVWLGADGSVSLSTNVGSSSGRVAGPNVHVADGQWHHVAAIFQRGAGGAHVTFSLKVEFVDYSRLNELPGMVPRFQASVKAALAAAAGTAPEHVTLALEEGFANNRRATRVHAIVNSPLEKAQVMRERLATLPWLGEAVARNVSLTPNIYAAVPLGLDVIIYCTELTLPALAYTGIASLYVDGLRGSGTVTFTPGADNLGMEGQLLVGGGHRGRAVACEVSRFRIWSTALATWQLEQLQRCDPASPRTIVGGAWPHDLLASYRLNGSYANAVAGTGFAALEDTSGGGFVFGGLCHHERCPPTSPEGCLLSPGREVRFDSVERCSAFAAWERCRTAGASRGRPPELMGCSARAAAS